MSEPLVIIGNRMAAARLGGHEALCRAVILNDRLVFWLKLAPDRSSGGGGHPGHIWR